MTEELTNIRKALRKYNRKEYDARCRIHVGEKAGTYFVYQGANINSFESDEVGDIWNYLIDEGIVVI